MAHVPSSATETTESQGSTSGGGRTSGATTWQLDALTCKDHEVVVVVVVKMEMKK